MTRLRLAALLVFAACGASQQPRPADPSPGPDRALGCTPPAGTSVARAKANCRARGRACRYQPALSCSGTQLPPESLAADRKARQEGTIGCQCVCPEDERMCHMLP